jgi:hypothetical protein
MGSRKKNQDSLKFLSGKKFAANPKTKHTKNAQACSKIQTLETTSKHSTN